MSTAPFRSAGGGDSANTPFETRTICITPSDSNATRDKKGLAPTINELKLRHRVASWLLVVRYGVETLAKRFAIGLLGRY